MRSAAAQHTERGSCSSSTWCHLQLGSRLLTPAGLAALQLVSFFPPPTVSFSSVCIYCCLTVCERIFRNSLVTFVPHVLSDLPRERGVCCLRHLVHMPISVHEIQSRYVEIAYRMCVSPGDARSAAARLLLSSPQVPISLTGGELRERAIASASCQRASCADIAIAPKASAFAAH